MALSKSPNAYPTQFFLLAERLERESPITVENLARPTAENLRFQFHGFRKAILASEQSSRFPNIEAVIVSLKANKHNDLFTVTFLVKDQTDFAKALDSVLTSLPAQPIPFVNSQPVEESSPQTQEDILTNFIGDQK